MSPLDLALKEKGLTWIQTRYVKEYAKGENTTNIARMFGVVPNTVKLSLQISKKKMGVKSKYELLVWCAKAAEGDGK